MFFLFFRVADGWESSNELMHCHSISQSLLVSTERAIDSAAQCELLVLFDEDFISILKPFMGKIWNEKKRAIRALDYFDFLDEDQVINYYFKLNENKMFSFFP